MKRILLSLAVIIAAVTAQAKTLVVYYCYKNNVNTIVNELTKQIDAMKEIGVKYNATPSQIAIAYAVTKGTLPIVGATKERHVKEAAEAAKICLSADELTRLEKLAAETGVDTRGAWENPMA